MGGVCWTVKMILEKFVDTVHDWLRVAIKGGVGYEYPLDAWLGVMKGRRWNVALSYSSNLSAGASYTSSSWLAQDNSINNYEEIRVFLYNEGASSVSLKVQQSNNNSNWYDIPNVDGNANITSSGGVAVGIWKVFMPYIRIVETNNDGTNAQTKNLVYVVML